VLLEESLVKRSTVTVVVVLITAVAIALAVGGNRVLRGYLEVPQADRPAQVASATPAPAPRPTRARTLSKKTYIDDILGRNIFDASAIGRESAAPATSGDEVMTDLKLTLVGTMVAIPSNYSSAFIAEEGKSVGTAYSLFQKVLDAEIVKIEVDKVHLKRASGAIEILALSEDKEAKTSRPKASKGAEASDDEGIEKVSDTKFTVDRDLVDKYIGNLDAIARMGRAIPHRGPDGEIDGYRLSGIRRNTMGQKLGIKNGDIVHGVNGQDLNSMQGAMTAFSSLQSESSFSFDITRRGQKMTLEYDIR
jgi:general secretion pathway protein C